MIGTILLIFIGYISFRIGFVIGESHAKLEISYVELDKTENWLHSKIQNTILNILEDKDLLKGRKEIFKNVSS